MRDLGDKILSFLLHRATLDGVLFGLGLSAAWVLLNLPDVLRAGP